MDFVLTAILLAVCSLGQAEWHPTSWERCRTNADCNNTATLCCSITPALGKRAYPSDFPQFVHYCLPYKTEASPWCVLAERYSPEKPNYMGLCPCGPGLACSPTQELNPKYYPREKFGRCKPVTQ